MRFLQRFWHGSILSVKDSVWLLGDILQDWGDKDKGEHLNKWARTFKDVE